MLGFPDLNFFLQFGRVEFVLVTHDHVENTDQVGTEGDYQGDQQELLCLELGLLVAHDNQFEK